MENAGGAGGKKAKKPAASGKSKRASEDDDDEIVVGEAGEEVVGENKPKAVKTPPQKKAKTAAPAAFAEDKVRRGWLWEGFGSTFQINHPEIPNIAPSYESTYEYTHKGRRPEHRASR